MSSTEELRRQLCKALNIYPEELKYSLPNFVGESQMSELEAVIDVHVANQINEVLDRLNSQSITVLPETYPTGNRTSIDAIPVSAIEGERQKLKGLVSKEE